MTRSGPIPIPCAMSSLCSSSRCKIACSFLFMSVSGLIAAKFFKRLISAVWFVLGDIARQALPRLVRTKDTKASARIKETEACVSVEFKFNKMGLVYRFLVCCHDCYSFFVK